MNPSSGGVHGSTGFQTIPSFRSSILYDHRQDVQYWQTDKNPLSLKDFWRVLSGSSASVQRGSSRPPSRPGFSNHSVWASWCTKKIIVFKRQRTQTPQAQTPPHPWSYTTWTNGNELPPPHPPPPPWSFLIAPLLAHVHTVIPGACEENTHQVCYARRADLMRVA